MTAYTFAFIQAVRGQAIRDMSQVKILASLTIAQAILESGWGRSGLTNAANNLYGIKAGSSWKGDTINLPTSECYNGKYVEVIAKFRKYGSWAESIADHTKLLLNDRYKPLIGVTDYKTACKIIRECGYATDPDYTNKLIKIIETYKLYEVDQEVINEHIEEVFENMDVKVLQTLLNNLGIRNTIDNKPLDVDGKEGTKTKDAKAQAKEIIGYILK
jgi:flagellum-specific peptidoglycan hydrolase FlgJ